MSRLTAVQILRLAVQNSPIFSLEAATWVVPTGFISAVTSAGRAKMGLKPFKKRKGLLQLVPRCDSLAGLTTWDWNNGSHKYGYISVVLVDGRSTLFL